MTANGSMSTHTPARRAPMRINAHKRVTMTAAISNGSHSSAPSGRITPSSFHSESEFESDDGLMRSASRRSKRNRPVDPTKDLVVIRPNDDISTVLGVTGTDLDEFIEVCNEGAGWRPTAGESTAASVHTPLVQNISNSSLSASVKDTSRRGKRLPPRVSTNTTLSTSEVHERLMECRTYFDYDADSEDELFLDQMAEDMHCSTSARSSKKVAVKAISGGALGPVTPEQLELIFNVLERELEIARVFHKQLDSVKLQYKIMLNAMAETKEMLNVLASDEEVSTSKNKSKINGKKKRNGKTARPRVSSTAGHYSSGIISEALEICDQHLLSARTVLEEVGVVGSVSADGAADGATTAVDLEASTPGPGHRRRRGRPPLHGRPRSGSDVNAIGSELTGPSTTKNKDKTGSREDDDPEYNLPPYYSVEELRELVPWAVAEGVIKEVLPDLFSKQVKHTSSHKSDEDGLDTCLILSSEVSELTVRAADSRLVLSPPYRVYEHWLSRRSPRRTSFLRGFHVFLMENWKASHALGTAVLPCSRDEVRYRLVESRKRLLRLRIDLDRARLIMDLVRKREKMKKMLFRNASECFDEVFSLQDPTEAAEKAAANKKKKKGRNGGKAPTELLNFYQAFSSEEESSSEGSEESSDNSESSSSEEEVAWPAPKRLRAGGVGSGSGGDNLVHLSMRSTAPVPEHSRSQSKRLKTLQATEPVLARLPQPVKTPTRSLAPETTPSSSHSKTHSVSKAATPCSLQNASMTKLPSSSSLSSTGSSPRINDHLPSSTSKTANITPRSAARVTRNAAGALDRDAERRASRSHVANDKKESSLKTASSSSPPDARSFRKKAVVSPVKKKSGDAYTDKLRANGLKRQQEHESPDRVSVTRNRSRSLRNRSKGSR